MTYPHNETDTDHLHIRFTARVLSRNSGKDYHLINEIGLLSYALDADLQRAKKEMETYAGCGLIIEKHGTG